MTAIAKVRVGATPDGIEVHIDVRVSDEESPCKRDPKQLTSADRFAWNETDGTDPPVPRTLR